LSACPPRQPQAELGSNVVADPHIGLVIALINLRITSHSRQTVRAGDHEHTRQHHHDGRRPVTIDRSAQATSAVVEITVVIVEKIALAIAEALNDERVPTHQTEARATPADRRGLRPAGDRSGRTDTPRMPVHAVQAVVAVVDDPER
jgi:hypothetical protein